MYFRALLLGSLLCGLAACQDDLVEPEAPAGPDGPQRVLQLADQPPEWRGYWRNGNTLWVYDMSPEIGLNTHPAAWEDFQLMDERMGMRLVRYGIYWNEYEAAEAQGCRVYYPSNNNNAACPSAGLAHAAYWASQRGMELVVNVTIGNCNQYQDWEAASCTKFQPSTMGGYAGWNQQYAAFMAKLAKRYEHQVRFWQLWNEPDGGYAGLPIFGTVSEACSGQRRLQGRRYADMLKVAYPAIQNAGAARRMWVLTAGMTAGTGPTLDKNGVNSGAPWCGNHYLVEPAWEFVRGMYENGGRDFFDIFAIHAYDQNAYAAGGIAGKVNQLVSEMTQANDADRPMWVTEFGAAAYTTSDGGRLLDPNQRASWPWQFDQDQRTYYEQALAYQAQSRQPQKIIGYALASSFSGGVDGADAAHSFLTTYPQPGPDTLNYGLGLFRVFGNGNSHANFADPRPAGQLLIDRAGANSFPRNRDADGGVEAPYRISTFAAIPNDVPFRYIGSDPTLLSIGPINVRTLHPTEVKFFTPVQLTPYVRNVGWMYTVYNNQVAGYATETRIMEMLRVQKFDNLPGMPALCVNAHSSVLGWGGRCDGGAVGSAGYQMEAVQMYFDGASPWTICYQVHSRHAAAFGWSSWACDGETAGTVGQAIPVGAVRVRIHRKPDRS